MRIAIINSNSTVVGGVEVYLQQLIEALAERGHSIGFWHEMPDFEGKARVYPPSGVKVWSVAGLGADSALAELAEWKPDVIYAHGLRSPDLEAETQRIAPAVFFAHSYYGSCISGTKTHQRVPAKPCSRRFGWKCLLHYYPDRCGGLNPRVMFREYHRQAERLSILRHYQTIITASSHMAAEYVKHGLADRLKVINLPVSTAAPQGDKAEGTRRRGPGYSLLFLGRMEFLKGGSILLEALPAFRSELGCPVKVVFAGDGPERADWEARANRLASQDAGLEFVFTGWLDAQRKSEVLDSCDLLVLPSVWPEPFGLVGLEAGLHSVPAVAFAVGGITDWLKDGVNGMLAHGNPPTARGLSSAMARCLGDKADLKALRQGAKAHAKRFSMQAHLEHLLPVLEGAAAANPRCLHNVAGVS
jgi:glycosyltransferase involved in cell wall biosynthesis